MMSAFQPSSYIHDRNPTKYGNKQQDYIVQCQAIVAWGIGEVIKCQKDEKRLTTLFFTLLEELGKKRNQIAKEHGTESAHEFGRRRDTDLGKDFYYTFLQGEDYSGYNKKLLETLAPVLQTLGIKSDKKNERHAEFCSQDENGAFEIKILEEKDLLERGWLEPPTLKEYPSDYPHNLALKKMKGTATSKEGRAYKKAMEDLKKEKIFLYQRLKMNLMFMTLNDVFPPSTKIKLLEKEVVIGNDANKKSLFLLCTARLKVNVEGMPKKFAASQYLIWMYRDFKQHPIDRMLKCSTAMIIHQDNFLIKDTLNEIASLFAKAVLWQKIQKIEELKRSAGLFRIYLSHCMPFERGTEAIAEWFEGILYGAHQFQLKYNNKIMVGLEIMTKMLPSQFLDEYEQMIELIEQPN